MIARTLGMPNLTDAAYQLREGRDVRVTENSLLCADAENNFGCAAERPRLMSQPGSRELQPTTTKSNLSRGQNRDFGFGHELANLRDCRRKPCPGHRFVRGTHQPGR